MQKNTTNREILVNGGDVALFPEIRNKNQQDTVCLQPKAQLKLLEGWSVDQIWLKRNPAVTCYPVQDTPKIEPKVDTTKKIGGKE